MGHLGFGGHCCAGSLIEEGRAGHASHPVLANIGVVAREDTAENMADLNAVGDHAEAGKDHGLGDGAWGHRDEDEWVDHPCG